MLGSIVEKKNTAPQREIRPIGASTGGKSFPVFTPRTKNVENSDAPKRLVVSPLSGGANLPVVPRKSTEGALKGTGRPIELPMASMAKKVPEKALPPREVEEEDQNALFVESMTPAQREAAVSEIVSMLSPKNIAFLKNKKNISSVSENATKEEEETNQFVSEELPSDTVESWEREASNANDELIASMTPAQRDAALKDIRSTLSEKSISFLTSKSSNKDILKKYSISGGDREIISPPTAEDITAWNSEASSENDNYIASLTPTQRAAALDEIRSTLSPKSIAFLTSGKSGINSANPKRVPSSQSKNKVGYEEPVSHLRQKATNTGTKPVESEVKILERFDMDGRRVVSPAVAIATVLTAWDGMRVLSTTPVTPHPWLSLNTRHSLAIYMLRAFEEVDLFVTDGDSFPNTDESNSTKPEEDFTLDADPRLTRGTLGGNGGLLGVGTSQPANSNDDATHTLSDALSLYRAEFAQQAVLGSRLLAGVCWRREVVCSLESYAAGLMETTSKSGTFGISLPSEGWTPTLLLVERFLACVEKFADCFHQLATSSDNSSFVSARAALDEVSAGKGMSSLDSCRRLAIDAIITGLLAATVATDLPVELPTVLLWGATTHAADVSVSFAKLRCQKSYLGGGSVEGVVSRVLVAASNGPVTFPQWMSPHTRRPHASTYEGAAAAAISRLSHMLSSDEDAAAEDAVRDAEIAVRAAHQLAKSSGIPPAESESVLAAEAVLAEAHAVAAEKSASAALFKLRDVSRKEEFALICRLDRASAFGADRSVLQLLSEYILDGTGLLRELVIASTAAVTSRTISSETKTPTRIISPRILSAQGRGRCRMAGLAAEILSTLARQGHVDIAAAVWTIGLEPVWRQLSTSLSGTTCQQTVQTAIRGGLSEPLETLILAVLEGLTVVAAYGGISAMFSNATSSFSVVAADSLFGAMLGTSPIVLLTYLRFLRVLSGSLYAPSNVTLQFLVGTPPRVLVGGVWHETIPLMKVLECAVELASSVENNLRTPLLAESLRMLVIISQFMTKECSSLTVDTLKDWLRISNRVVVVVDTELSSIDQSKDSLLYSSMAHFLTQIVPTKSSAEIILSQNVSTESKDYSNLPLALLHRVVRYMISTGDRDIGLSKLSLFSLATVQLLLNENEECSESWKTLEAMLERVLKNSLNGDWAMSLVLSSTFSTSTSVLSGNLWLSLDSEELTLAAVLLLVTHVKRGYEVRSNDLLNILSQGENFLTVFTSSSVAEGLFGWNLARLQQLRYVASLFVVLISTLLHPSQQTNILAEIACQMICSISRLDSSVEGILLPIFSAVVSTIAFVGGSLIPATDSFGDVPTTKEAAEEAASDSHLTILHNVLTKFITGPNSQALSKVNTPVMLIERLSIATRTQIYTVENTSDVLERFITPTYEIPSHWLGAAAASLSHDELAQWISGVSALDSAFAVLTGKNILGDLSADTASATHPGAVAADWLFSMLRLAVIENRAAWFPRQSLLEADEEPYPGCVPAYRSLLLQFLNATNSVCSSDPLLSWRLQMELSSRIGDDASLLPTTMSRRLTSSLRSQRRLQHSLLPPAALLLTGTSSINQIGGSDTQRMMKTKDSIQTFAANLCTTTVNWLVDGEFSSLIGLIGCVLPWLPPAWRRRFWDELGSTETLNILENVPVIDCMMTIIDSWPRTPQMLHGATGTVLLTADDVHSGSVAVSLLLSDKRGGVSKELKHVICRWLAVMIVSIAATGELSGFNGRAVMKWMRQFLTKPSLLELLLQELSRRLSCIGVSGSPFEWKVASSALRGQEGLGPISTVREFLAAAAAEDHSSPLHL